MASRRFSTEEVRDIVMRVEEGEEGEEEEESGGIGVDRTDSDDEKLRMWLSSFDGFDVEFFEQSAMEALKPILDHSRIENRTAKDASRRLCTATLSAGSILRNESRVWLDGIFKRLSGRVSVRRPYWADITRNIPYDLFSACKMVVRDLGVGEPDCCVTGNRKGEVISITNIDILFDLLSCISALSVRDIKEYMTRKIKSGSRQNHKVKLIISKNKDFAFFYKKKTGQLHIQFHYGEWNSNNFPRHQCKNKLWKYTNVD